MNNGRGKPIVAIDIDGTLGDYHSHFLAFAEKWVGQTMPHPDQINPGQPLWRFMGVDKQTYKECKLAYRQGGLKRWMPAYPGVADLTAAIQGVGAEVWICTTRPYLRLDNIDPDTREWLQRAEIVYDAVLFDMIDRKYSKYRELARQAGPRVACIMDDLPEAIEAIPRDKMPNLQRVLLHDQPYNRHLRDTNHTRIERGRLTLAWGEIRMAIENWREATGNV